MSKNLKLALGVAVLTNPLVWLALVLATLFFGIALYVVAARAAYRHLTRPAHCRARTAPVSLPHPETTVAPPPPYQGAVIVREPVHMAPNRLLPQFSAARVVEAPRKRQAKALSPARLKKMSREELLKTGKRLGLKGLSPRMTRQTLIWRLGTAQEVA
jgi:hypothetical protein